MAKKSISAKRKKRHPAIRKLLKEKNQSPIMLVFSTVDSEMDEICERKKIFKREERGKRGKEG